MVRESLVSYTPVIPIGFLPGLWLKSGLSRMRITFLSQPVWASLEKKSKWTKKKLNRKKYRQDHRKRWKILSQRKSQSSPILVLVRWQPCKLPWKMRAGQVKVGQSLQTCLTVKKKMAMLLKETKSKRMEKKGKGKAVQPKKQKKKNEALESCKAPSIENEESESDDSGEDMGNSKSRMIGRQLEKELENSSATGGTGGKEKAVGEQSKPKGNKDV